MIQSLYLAIIFAVMFAVYLYIDWGEIEVRPPSRKYALELALTAALLIANYIHFEWVHGFVVAWVAVAVFAGIVYILGRRSRAQLSVAAYLSLITAASATFGWLAGFLVVLAVFAIAALLHPLLQSFDDNRTLRAFSTTYRRRKSSGTVVQPFGYGNERHTPGG